MRVELVGRTQSVFKNENGPLTISEFLAMVARVSNPSNQMNHETSPKLLSYCLRNGHWSVFESASLTICITTSIAIARQILRHRSFTFQEFSQRYAESTTREVYRARRKDNKNRQNSIDDLPESTRDWFINAQFEAWELCYKLYMKAIKQHDIAPEQARFLLPVSTQTTLYVTGNIRSWIHYCEARCKNGVQLEHREIAEACKQILLEEVPDLSDYFNGGKSV